MRKVFKTIIDFIKIAVNKIIMFLQKTKLFLKTNKAIYSLVVFILFSIWAIVFYRLSKVPNIGEKLESYTIFSNKALSAFSRMIPFSLYATLIAVAIPLIVFIVIKFIKSNYKLKFLLNLGSIVCAIIVVFYSTFGFAYKKQGVYSKLNIDLTTEVERDEVAEAARYFVALLNEKSNEIERDTNGLVITSYSYKEISDIVQIAYEEFESKTTISLNFLYDIYSPAKKFYTAFFMNYSGIVGTFFPIFAEPNVVSNIPRIYLPTTIAHEMSHSKGITNEGEANFIAYLVCATSDDDYIAYSGLVECSISLLNSLYSYDQELYKEIYASMNEEVRAEIRAANAFYRKYDGSWKKISTKINDSYLKSNDVSDGVESYSQSTRGLVAFYYRFIKEV